MCVCVESGVCVCFFFFLSFLEIIICKYRSVRKVPLSTAVSFRAMLQELNGVVAAKENIAQGRMSEKERTIVSQKSEIERLEKKIKTLEYKVSMQLFSN